MQKSDYEYPFKKEIRLNIQADFFLHFKNTLY